MRDSASSSAVVSARIVKVLVWVSTYLIFERFKRFNKAPRFLA